MSMPAREKALNKTEEDVSVNYLLVGDGNVQIGEYRIIVIESGRLTLEY